MAAEHFNRQQVQYNDFIDHITDDAESGIGVNKDINPDSLVIAVHTQYSSINKREME